MDCNVGDDVSDAEHARRLDNHTDDDESDSSDDAEEDVTIPNGELRVRRQRQPSAESRSKIAGKQPLQKQDSLYKESLLCIGKLKGAFLVWVTLDEIVKLGSTLGFLLYYKDTFSGVTISNSWQLFL